MLFAFFIIFIFGLVIGSFLNVVIFRMETEEDIVNSRSHCMHCRKKLAWYDLVPLLSFLTLRGRCRYCKKPISWQYPFVELATGILFVMILDKAGGLILESANPLWDILNLLVLFVVSAALVVIFVYDLRHYIIPDKIVFPLVGIMLFYRLLGVGEYQADRSAYLDSINGNLFWFWNLFIPQILGEGGALRMLTPLLDPLLAAIAAGGFFFIIVVLTKGKGMGGGDVKLAFLMGLVLGFYKTFVAMYFAFTLGAVFGIILIAFRKKTFKSALPFGPFLVLGALIALLR